MTIVLATGNAGKVREFERLLGPLGHEVVSQTQLNIGSVEETGLTFFENALIKARHATRASGHPAIADDSGLVVPSLNGAPGIYSARYAGAGASDEDNNRKLVADLNQNSAPAYFYCALVYLRHASDPTPILAGAAWHGTFISDPRGERGFGYDPHFWVASENCTSAELEPARKNALSHRGQATVALLAQLAEEP